VRPPRRSVDIKEGGPIRHALRLLHVVGDDRDCVPLLQFLHQLLDPMGRDWVERRARLVHQQHRRFGSDRARDTEALLLAAGQGEAAGIQLVLNLVPQRGVTEGFLNPLAVITVKAVELETESDVAINRHGERIRLLEDHADVPTHGHRVDFFRVDVLAAKQHTTLEAEATHGVVHAVETAQRRALTAS